MHDHAHNDTATALELEAARACTEELRTALAEHGIALPALMTLPGLSVDLPTYPVGYRTQPLVILGNCGVGTAQRLTAVLTAAARRTTDR